MFVDAIATHEGATKWSGAFEKVAHRYDADFAEMTKATQRRIEWLNKDSAYFINIPGLGQRAWRAYLSSFPASARKPHHCDCCKEFFLRWGGVVGVMPGGDRYPLIVGNEVGLYGEFLRSYHKSVVEMTQGHYRKHRIPTLVLFQNDEVGVKRHVSEGTVWEHLYFAGLPERQTFKSRSYDKVLQQQAKMNDELLQFIESTEKVKKQKNLVVPDHTYLIDSVIAELKKNSELVRFVPPLLLLQDALEIARRCTLDTLVGECIVLFFRYRDRIGNKAWSGLMPVKAVTDYCCNSHNGRVTSRYRHSAAKEIAKAIAEKGGSEYMRKSGEVSAGAAASLEAFMTKNGITLQTLTRRIARVGELCQYPGVAAWLTPAHPCNEGSYGIGFRVEAITAPAKSDVAKALRKSARVKRALEGSKPMWCSSGWASEDLLGWGNPMDLTKATRPMLNSPEASSGWLSQGLAVGITLTQLVELLQTEQYQATEERVTRIYLSPGEQDTLMATTMPLDLDNPNRAAVLKWDVEALKSNLPKGLPMSMYVTDSAWRVQRRVDANRNRCFHAVDAILRTGASALQVAAADINVGGTVQESHAAAPSHCGYTVHLHPAVTTELVRTELITGSGTWEEIIHTDCFQHAGAMAALGETLPMQTPSTTQGYQRYARPAQYDNGVTAYWQQAANQWAVGVDYRQHQHTRLQRASTSAPKSQLLPYEGQGPFSRMDSFFTQYSPLVLVETNSPRRGVSTYALFCLTGI